MLTHPSLRQCFGLVIGILLCSLAFGQNAPLELLHKMQNTLGGTDKLLGISDFDETVRADTWDRDGKPTGIVRKRTRWIKPNLLRLDQVGPHDTYVLYFDGTSGWEILPDRHTPFKTEGIVKELVNKELDFARGYLSGFFLNQWLADRIPGNVFSSPAPNVLRISVNRDFTDVTLDPISFLPTQVGPNVKIQEWTQVEGIRFPARRSISHNGIRLADLKTEEINVNSGLRPQDLKIQPTDFYPVMTAR